MKPLKHQEKFQHNYKGPNLLVHEAGTGKTICACLWLRDGRDKESLVVCPKRVVQKWIDTLKTWGTSAKVISKEQFKRDFKELMQTPWKYVVIDECDWFASPIFSGKRSQLTTCMYQLVKQYHPQMLLLSATPIRSNPWNLHTLLTLGGNYIDWRKWQDYFFELKRLPFLPRPAYMPKKNWRELIRPILEKHSDIVLMKDCVDSLPAIKNEYVKVKKDPFIPTKWEGSAAFFEEHRHEQKNKIAHIKEIAQGYRKVLVVAYYKEQLERLEVELSKDRETFLIYGNTKNQETVVKQAQASEECYFIVQASVGEGFDADTFSCVIFASMSYSVRDYVQMKARVRRIHNLHPVIYYFLLAGDCDHAIFKNVQLGKSFVPSEWSASRTTKTI